MAVGRERQNESSDTDDNDFIDDRSTKDKQASIGSNSETNDLVNDDWWESCMIWYNGVVYIISPIWGLTFSCARDWSTFSGQLEQQQSKLEEMRAKETNKEKEIEELATKQAEMESPLRVQQEAQMQIEKKLRLKVETRLQEELKKVLKWLDPPPPRPR
ncbi:hypothetical protein CJ030_MR1G022531 [Morella rubra]|uniref:Uncharacterized protein n=1 Tax=Morella rubra TaxID=262757 RepID=A0A6A1WVN2_9ROSI|nr:hypothetical protein CJ030_MR1G022531 [Morella rubra]